VTALPMGMPQQLTNGNGAANHKWECRSDSQMGMPQRLTNGNAAATHKWECRSDPLSVREWISKPIVQEADILQLSYHCY